MKNKVKRIAIGVAVLLLAILLIKIGAKSGKYADDEALSGDYEDEDYGSDTTSAFYTDEYGNTYANGDLSMSAEDVVYAFVKSLSLLDFNSALKYAYTGSKVIEGYSGKDTEYNSEGTGYSTAYNFNHKIYKLTVQSLLVDSIVDTVIYPDSYIITLKIKHLDCINNEFWLEDKDKIFAQLLKYRLEEDSESCDNKTREYLAEYIKDCYSSSKAPTEVNEIELTLRRSEVGAWVIDDDSDLYALCSYNDGGYVIDYIYNQFNVWYDEYLDSIRG